MNLAEVLELLVLFGIQEEEAKKLLAQSDGWEKIQKRVDETRNVIDDVLASRVKYEEICKAYNKVMSISLKSVQKSPEQEAKERREVAEKLKNINKKENPFDMFGDLFGGLGKK